jgi:hypothetical protein
MTNRQIAFQIANKSYKSLTILTTVFLFFLILFNNFSLDLTAATHSSVKMENASGIVEEGYFINPAPLGQYSREIEYNHDGLDLFGPVGTPIIAAADGKVFYKNKSIGDSAGYGFYLILEHEIQGRKIYTLYAHLQKRVTLEINSFVEQGELIGYMGSTGYSTGSHLHFAIISKLVHDPIKNPNPTCLKKYGKYASTCLSPLNEPIKITSHFYEPKTISLNKFEPLKDVETDYIFWGEINRSYQKGYLANNLDIEGNFRPTANVTTVESLKVIDRAILSESSDTSCKQNKVTNIEKTDLLLTTKFSCLGILNRFEQIDSNAEISYSELSEILIASMKQNRQLKNKANFNFKKRTFIDLDETNKYYDSIMTMLGLEIIKGYSDGTFKPDEKVTRGHLIAIISKIDELK